MKIKDLSDEHLESYCVCLEDWSDEMKEAGNHKACWYNEMKDKGLRVKLAVNDDGKALGMIQYLPAEHSYAEGINLYAILCIWVHGHKEGPGNHQKKGLGKALLQAAEKDMRELGAEGAVAWGLPIPVWMKAAWFKKQGYVRADKLGFLGPELIWKTFSENAAAPRWIRQKRKPEKVAGQVTVTGYINGWCPGQNIAFERAKRATVELGGKVSFREIVTRNRETLLDWGITDALYIDDKRVRTGPPPSYKKIKNKIAKKVARLS